MGISDRITERRWKSKEPDLLPCPFCDGGADISEEGPINVLPAVTCSKCGASTWGGTVTIAVGKWNRRAAHDLRDAE